MDILCPKGHVSADADYCSECGAKIAGTAGLPSIAESLSAGVLAIASDAACPDCGTPQANPTATFCEVCRYNFVTHTSWAGASAVPAAPPTPPAATSPAPAILGWDITVIVDPTLYMEPDPALPCPAGDPERHFPLDLPDNLIGRRSERRGIFPEVPLTDPGVSHRHAKLLKRPDGGVALLDLGSANGTGLNGSIVAAGVETPLGDGDQITLGCWTRLTLRKRD